MPSVHEQLSEQFYKWETRGRGWQVFGEPVYPEPPFQPFHGHYLPETPAIDDGRRPTFLSSLFRKASPPPPVIEVEEEPEPTPLVRDSLIEFQAALPADLDIARESFDQFFRNLSLCREPIAFELLGLHKRVVAQFAASPEDAAPVRRQLSAHFPDVQFRQLEGALENAWDASKGDEAFAVEFGLEREFMLPLTTGKLDPFIGIVGAMTELQPDELAVFQILWQPVQNPWAESIVNSVTHSDGKPFFVNQPELAGAAEKKVACPLYAAVVRMLLRTSTTSRLQQICREFGGSLRAYTNVQGNALIPLHNDDYPSAEDHIDDVLKRQSRRSGMILNSDELIGFVHLPSSAVRSTVFLRDAGKTKAAPADVQRPSGLVIGDNEHNGQTVPIHLSADQRVRHTHIIGIPGMGKSSLLFNLIRQDIENGQGVGVLDPHGDLIDLILGIIPEHRIKDVVLVNLSDAEFPIGFNILQAHSEDEKTLLASDLVAVLQRFSSAWGDQMDTVLQNAILAFLYSSRGGTLSDLRRFLVEKPYHREFLQTVTDPEIKYYWQTVFPELSGGKSINSVLTRLQNFFSRKPLRNMVSQRENKLDFEDIMDNQKIFLARLPEGLNGAENVYLLGSLLVAKFQQLAMARQNREAADRKDFWLYVDEFEHFISPSMAAILTGARKYRLGMTLGHQELHQLQSDPKVASAVTSSVCTRIVLRVGDDDAKKLAEGFESFDATSLKTLAKFHAIARVERNDWDFNLALRKPELPAKEQTDQRKAEVIAASRAQYGTPRAAVEAAWLAGLGIEKSPPPPPQPPDGGSAPAPLKPKPILPPSGTPQGSIPQSPPESFSTEIQKTTAFRSVESTETTTGSRKKNVPEVQSGEAAPTIEAAVVQTPPVSLPNAEVPNTKQGETIGADDEDQHNNLKNDITTQAESLDYTVLPEASIPLHGRIDLILTRGKRSIACEISVTTPAEKEADHIRLRLKAGFQQVAVISANRRKLILIQEAYLRLDKDLSKVGFYTPKEFSAQLFDWATDDPEGGKIEKGKPRKRVFNFDKSSEGKASRAEKEEAMLVDLKQIMDRNRKG